MDQTLNPAALIRDDETFLRMNRAERFQHFLLVVADEGGGVQCLVHRVLILWKRSAAMKIRKTEIIAAMTMM